jgi:glycosyltransferase involved in cell wall biosynthesis
MRGVAVHRVATATRGRARLSGRALDYASFHLSAAWKLTRILQRGDIVVAKTDPPLISVSAMYAARLKGAMLVNWLQDLFPEIASALAPHAMPNWLEKVLLAARDSSLRCAATNVVLSEGMGDRLRARGIDSERVQPIPNWANPSEVVPLPAESSVTRQRLGLNGTFVVGYSGNLGRAHEFDTLVGAAVLLREHDDIRFLITGGGAKVAQLRQAVTAAGLRSFVFQPYQPAEMLSDSLACADIHLVSLLPSMEGLIVPSKVYGVFAAGRPTAFVGDVSGDIAALIRKHDCGFAVGVGDCQGLAEQLRALCGDLAIRTSMGTRARNLAVSRFTSEHAVAEWLRMLNRLCNTTVTADA